jgi:hypothetical protein
MGYPPVGVKNESKVFHDKKGCQLFSRAMQGEQKSPIPERKRAFCRIKSWISEIRRSRTERVPCPGEPLKTCGIGYPQHYENSMVSFDGSSKPTLEITTS